MDIFTCYPFYKSTDDSYIADYKSIKLYYHSTNIPLTLH